MVVATTTLPSIRGPQFTAELRALAFIDFFLIVFLGKGLVGLSKGLFSILGVGVGLGTASTIPFCGSRTGISATFGDEVGVAIGVAVEQVLSP